MIKNAVIFVLTSVLLFVMMDVYLLISEIQTPHFSMIDPVKGKVNIPDRKVLFISEGFYMGSTNHYGYWGPGYPPEKKENEYRIALLGNSFVEGIQVFDKYHFRTILEKNLNKSSHRKVEVLNFGKGRSNLSDMFYSYNFFVRQFHPDAALFFIDYTSGDIGWDMGVADLAPFYYLSDDHLEIDYSFRDQRSFKIIQSFQFLLKNSSITRLLYNCYKTYSSGNTFAVLFDKFANLSRKESTSAVPNTPKFPPLNPTARRIISEIIKNRNNIIVFNPRDRTVLPKEISDMVPSAQLIDLSRPLDSLLSIGIDPNYWKVAKTEGHWNHYGHEAVGDYLSNWFLHTDRNAFKP